MLKRFVAIIISFLISCSLYAQSEETMSKWLNNGYLAYKEGHYKEAISNFLLVKDCMEKNKQKDDGYIRIVRLLALCYSDMGDFSQAIENGTKALELVESEIGKNHLDYIEIINELANYYVSLGDFSKAVELGIQSVELTKTVLGTNHPDYIMSLQYLANYYSKQGNNFKAIELCSKAMEIIKSEFGDDHLDYITSLNLLAHYISDSDNYIEALKYAKLASDKTKKVLGEEHLDYIESLKDISIIYTKLGNYEKALEYRINAVEIAKSILGEKDLNYGIYLIFLASSFSDLGDYSKAIELNHKAKEILYANYGEEHPNYAIALNNLAVNYIRIGDYSKALDYCNKALDIQKTTIGENHSTYVTTLNNIGLCYTKLGDFAKAVEYSLLASEKTKNIEGENSLNYATYINNLAINYSKLGNHSEAIKLDIKAAEIFKSIFGEDHPKYVESLNNLAGLYNNIGDFENAMTYGRLALEKGKLVLGENHPFFSLLISNLAGYYSKLGEWPSAIRYGSMAIEKQKILYGENHPTFANSLVNLSQFHYNFNEYSDALEYIVKGVFILESNTLQNIISLPHYQRTSYWTQHSYIFTDLYPSLFYRSPTLGTTDLYDKSALFAKGLLLTTEMEMNRLIQESGDEEALRMFEELRHQRFQLQKLYETPLSKRYLDADSLAQVADQLERKLVVRSKVYGDFTKKLRTTWQDVQKSLTEDEIAIEFLSFNVYGTDSTMVAALTLRKDDKEPKFVPLFELGQLQGVSDTEHFICSEVARLVWEPLQKELRGIRRIYFSPAGVLHTIAIEYTPGMEEYEMCRLSTTREIIDIKASAVAADEVGAAAALYGGVDYETMNSTKLVLSTETQNPSTSDAFTREFSLSQHRAFVDSLDLRGQSISYLPSTLDEVKSIQASLEGSRRSAKVYVGPEATETSLKSLSGHSPNVLHLATHGFYFTEKQSKKHDNLLFLTDNDQRSGDMEDKTLTRSGLFMAGANKVLEGENVPMDSDDGILTAREISRLDLRGTDLVVLSACETGKGDIKQGEGVFGLQRSFKKAGAKTIVMSLWNVSDLPTQMLMTEFYKNLCSGKGKRESLRLAQKTVREYKDSDGSLLFQNPHYWAGFVILD